MGSEMVLDSRQQECCSGFTLIEALVALAVATILLASIGSLVAGNIRGVARIEQHLSLSETLRAVEAGLPDRDSLVGEPLSGEMQGKNWAVEFVPYQADVLNPRAAAIWVPQQIMITVKGPTGATLQIQTIRLAKKTGGL